MVIHLYTCTDEKNRLVKSLSREISLMGNLRDGCSILSPEIVIQHEIPLSYNYLYIPDFSRYYYVREIKNVRTGLWLLYCSIDVLMTYHTGILDISVLVPDAESTDESYVVGEQYKTTVKTKTDVINFPSGLSDTGEYILITSGGVINV